MIDQSLGDEIMVTVIATGFKRDENLVDDTTTNTEPVTHLNDAPSPVQSPPPIINAEKEAYRQFQDTKVVTQEASFESEASLDVDEQSFSPQPLNQQEPAETFGKSSDGFSSLSKRSGPQCGALALLKMLWMMIRWMCQKFLHS